MHDGTRPLPLALKACLFLAAFTLFAAVYALTDAARVLRCGCVRQHGSAK